MPTLTADKVLNKNLYSKGTVNVTNYPDGKVLKIISNGKLIGTVYSWVMYNGNLYWMFNDLNGQPYYAKQDYNIDFPGLNDTLKQIDEETKANEIKSKGALNYYLQKYLPWIVGGVVVALVLPAILKNRSK